MKNKATLLLHSFDELISCLTDEEAGRLLKAILDYDIRGETADFDDRALQFLYIQIKKSLDTHKAHYEKVCDARKKSAEIRWTASDTVEKNAEKMQMHANAYNININENEKENINEKENSKENVCVKESRAGSSATDTHTHKKAYGEFCNVFLTDEEYELVKTKLPEGERRLGSFSAYMKATGKTYADHYARLLNWSVYGNEPSSRINGGRDISKKPPGERREPTFDVSLFMKKALNPVFVPPEDEKEK